MSHPFVDEVIAALARGAAKEYGRDRVSQLEHALQAATLAERSGASPALICAALLHDIGHVVNTDDRAALGRGVDARHEDHGKAYLERWYGPEVTEPVRLHVDAKRYLTATDPTYAARLSPGSVRSLALQGGPFSPEEVLRFEAEPHHAAAVQVRRWDEEAKDPLAETPPLAHFRRYLEACLRAA